MKSLFLSLTFILSSSALADMDFQMKNALGDWKCEGIIKRVMKQSSNSIKILQCDWTRYHEDEGYCLYSSLLVGTYNSQYAGFCVPAHLGGIMKRCGLGFQVSAQYPYEALEVFDPMYLYNAGNSGKVNSTCTKFSKT